MNNPYLKEVHQQLLAITSEMQRIGAKDPKLRERLEAIKQAIYQHPFSLASIVLGGKVIYLLTEDVMMDPETLDLVVQELKGERPNWNTTVIKHDFTSDDKPAFVQMYQSLHSIVSVIRKGELQSAEIDWLDTATSDLYDLVYEKVPETIDELVLFTACNALFRLPMRYPAQFDLDDERGGYRPSFSSILVNELTVELDEHLSYITKLLDVLRGERPLYIDVSMLDDYQMINLR